MKAATKFVETFRMQGFEIVELTERVQEQYSNWLVVGGADVEVLSITPLLAGGSCGTVSEMDVLWAYVLTVVYIEVPDGQTSDV